MICQNCQTSFPNGTTICPQCTAPVHSTGVQAVERKAGSVLALLFASVYLLLTLALFSFVQFRRQGNWISAIGYEIGAALIPAILVLLYYRKKTTVSSARIVFVATSWILLASVMTSSRSRGNHISEADIPTIAKEAAGIAPITDPDNQGRAVVRDYFKELFAQNRDYESKVAKFEWDSLYTPKSYLDPNGTNQVLAEIGDAMKLEKQQEAFLATITNRFKDRINALDWSDNEKQQFIQGFDSKYSETLRSRKQILDSEYEFLGSLHDVYTLVSGNRRYFKMSNGRVVVTDDKVLAEFNRDIELTNERRSRYQSALKASKQQRDQGVTKLGLSNREAGLSSQ